MPTTPHVDPGRVRRVLLIRPRFLGDICLTLPALDAVREAAPRARIAYLVEEEAAPLLAGDPRLAECIVVKRNLGVDATVALIVRLQRFAPDLTIDFFCNPRTAIWSFASGARVRVGYPNKGWRSALYTHRVQPRTLSAIGFHLASLTAIGWPARERTPRLHVGPDRISDARTALDEMGIARDAVLVGFHPGARWPTRRWAPDRFAALAARFLDAEPRGVALVTGGPGDEDRVAEVLKALPAGRAHAILGWPIGRLVGLQAQCRAFVCGDTGPLHTAVAAGCPTLGLMSRNRPAMFFPYAESEGHRAHYARVECSPCDRDTCADLRCLERLGVDGAWSRLSDMLGVRTRAVHDPAAVT